VKTESKENEQGVENEDWLRGELSQARNFYRVRWHDKIVCQLGMTKECPLGGVDCRTCAVAQGRKIQ